MFSAVKEEAEDERVLGIARVLQKGSLVKYRTFLRLSTSFSEVDSQPCVLQHTEILPWQQRKARSSLPAVQFLDQTEVVVFDSSGTTLRT